MLLNSIDALKIIGTEAKLETHNGKVTKIPHQAELEEQAALIGWADKTVINGINIGDYLLHIPNEGKRGPKAARDAKRLGMKKGVHDLFLALPRRGYSGLWIEMKAIDGKVTQSQLEWQSLMRGAGYRAEVCYGFNAARSEIERYVA
ncbi:VRR-NUC domain-containing protein [Pectobacterium brasiliense]|uniref:VRR-NUC domain-containing protein n=1 Tax=Pectobacterium brasiliense TaxID=180957 RepID=UPI001D0D22C3|nr:VRR-NUC domain-containing protein [Pectobacterium brasiliense]UDQ77732.1 VRR-NUC domain-containing protein [Pectobacterium brasiliense]